jgi:hypothetical protein
MTIFRGVANSPNDMRGVEWVPIAMGIGFFVYAIVTRNKGKTKPTIGDWIFLCLVCGLMIAGGIWAYVRDSGGVPR